MNANPLHSAFRPGTASTPEISVSSRSAGSGANSVNLSKLGAHSVELTGSCKSKSTLGSISSFFSALFSSSKAQSGSPVVARKVRDFNGDFLRVTRLVETPWGDVNEVDFNAALHDLFQGIGRVWSAKNAAADAYVAGKFTALGFFCGGSSSDEKIEFICAALVRSARLFPDDHVGQLLSAVKSFSKGLSAVDRRALGDALVVAATEVPLSGAMKKALIGANI